MPMAFLVTPLIVSRGPDGVAGCTDDGTLAPVGFLMPATGGFLRARLGSTPMRVSIGALVPLSLGAAVSLEGAVSLAGAASFPGGAASLAGAAALEGAFSTAMPGLAVTAPRSATAAR